MDLNDPNFFRLNYLCISKLSPMSNQNIIIEKNIQNTKKIQKAKSGMSQKLITTPKYSKIDNSKILFHDKNLNKKKQITNRTRSNNKKIFNNKYQSYYSESNRVNTIARYPISASPTTPLNRENKQKNYNLNLYNEIICKTNNNNNNKKHNLIGNDSNYSRENISSGNIFNNNYIPLTEIKNNYLNNSNSNTYIHTNFVFKIDDSANFNKVLYKDSSFRKSPIKKRSKNLKKFFDYNNFNQNNKYSSQNESNSNSNFNINNNSNINNNIYEKQDEIESNISLAYKGSFKSDNNNSHTMVENPSFKSDFNKMIKNKNKNGLNLIINSLKKENNSQTILKIKNLKRNKNIEIKINNKNIKNNLSIDSNKYLYRKKNLSNINNSHIIKKYEGENLIKDQKEKNENEIKKNYIITSSYNNDKDNDKDYDNQKDHELKEFKISNNELKNNITELKTQLDKYENDTKLNQKYISKLKNHIIKLNNENENLKTALKNTTNIKISNTPSSAHSPSSNKTKSNTIINNKNNSKNKLSHFTQTKKDLEISLDKIKHQNELYKKEIKEKNKIIKEKEEIIKSLSDQIEQNNNKINSLEKGIEEIKKENDNLYKYKSLYEDKEIELIQYKNNLNKYKTENNRYDSLKLEYDTLLSDYNEIKDFKNKYSSVLKEMEKLKNIENKYNDLLKEFNYIKEKDEEMQELKDIKNKYNELLKEYNKLNDIKNKYDRMEKEFEELKVIREKYGKILKEQKNLLLIENKYNDLIEEVAELREIKNEYEKLMENKEPSENSNIFKFQNISFGNENGII